LSALVTLLGAGPGDLSQITPAGVLALGRADVVIGDPVAHRAWLSHASPGCLVVEAPRAQSAREWVEVVARHASAGRAVCWIVAASDAAALASIAVALNERSVSSEWMIEANSDPSAEPSALVGINVAITRPRAQQSALAGMLRSRGANCWDFAAIEVRALTDRAPLLAAVDRVQRSAVLAFTSANGVDAFFDAIDERGFDARLLAPCSVASVGRATSERLRARGVRADIAAAESVGESLAEAILAALGARAASAKVMVVRAVRGREGLVRALTDAGIEVDLVHAYDTVASASLDGLRAALESGTLDVVTFASGSAVDATLNALGADALQLLSPVTIATVGPVTTQHARAAGLTVHCQAEHASDESLVRALDAHFARARAG
jgi:uroporphyrinogen-III synthase